MGLSESRDRISQDHCNCIVFRRDFPGALPSPCCKLHLKLHKVTMAFFKERTVPFRWTWKTMCSEEVEVTWDSSM